MLLCVPREIRAILDEFVESVFAQRPTLVPESIPLVLVGESGAAAVGSATLVLDGASTLRVSSIMLRGGRSCLHVVALAAGDDTTAPPTAPLLARLVAPRCALSLPRPAALDSLFACVECAAAAPSSSDGDADDDVAAAATSLRAWCLQAAEAIAAGKRFAPVLRRPWAWTPPSSGAAAATPMPLQFRPGGTDGSAPIAVDVVVPLGSGCSAAVACRTAGLRSDGLPFDWVLSSLESNVELIEALLRPTAASAAVGIPFDGREPAIPLCHITNTNNYVSARAGNAKDVASTTPSTHVFDARYGIVASNTEAARFPRRAARLRDVLSAARTVVFVYIGRPHRDAESLTVDGRTVHDHTSADSGDRLVAAANRLFTCVCESHRRGSAEDGGEEAATAASPPHAVSVVFFAFNCAQHDFTHVASDFSPSQLLLVHKFVGFADPSASWDSIGHVVGRLLPDPAAMRVRASCQHLE